MRKQLLLLWLLLGASPALAQTVLAQTAQAQTPAQRDVHKPNLDLYVYRRAYTPDEKVTLRLSAYNQKAVAFTAYRLDLPALVPDSRALADMRTQINALDVGRLRVAQTWTFALPGKIYPDQWNEYEAKAPFLPPGVYLIRATGGGAEKRTWLAVTEIALLSKRSRQELLVYAAQARTGQPMPNLRLALVDAQGRREHGVTDAQGVWRLRRDVPPNAPSNLWLYGERNGSPAFGLAGSPPAPDPFAVYTVTDRPIYRPTHLVQFKGTVRQRLESDGPTGPPNGPPNSPPNSPGGFTYRPYQNKRAVVEIRDATDALVSRQTVTTNAQGSFAGSFQLASEPTLGRWQLIVTIGDFRSYAGFEVQAYRKPEVTVGVQIAAAHVLGGATVPVTIEAKYFFGQPVADANVRYTVRFTPESMGRQGGNVHLEPPIDGQGVTDARGQLKLEIKTQRLPVHRRLSVQAVVTDLSRRSQTGEGSLLVTAGQFHLALRTEKYLYRPQEPVHVLVHAEDYDGKPVATTVRVRLIETKYDRNRRPYQEITARDITTDAKGEGVAIFTPPRPGYLALTAQAFDSENDKIETEGTVWIAGDEVEGYDYPTLTLLADRQTYRPGETATLLLNTSLVTPRNVVLHSTRRTPRGPRGSRVVREAPPTVYRRAWALVTVEGERLYQQMLVPIDSRTTTLRVPLADRYFPSVEVSVVLVQERHIYEQQVRLGVQRDNQKLSVGITPDKDRYLPGESATYTLTTRDYLGYPVSAELALGVVDASIYALAADNAPDLSGLFYSGQQVRIQTDFSFAAQYSGGAFQTIPVAQKQIPPEQPAAPTIRVRRLFADTAYWNPFVVTDGSGTAKVTFALPDNLTRWRATARGITLQTAVGSGVRDVIASMPLQVRLELPRFYVQGDQATVSAIVRNDTGTERAVTARIEATGATLEGDVQRTLTLPAGGQQRLDWRATIAPGEGSGAKTARFRVTADGGAGAQDATEQTLSVAADGVPMVEVKAATLTEAAPYRLDLSQLPPDATLTLNLAPSLAAALFDALDDLAAYPYGCAEQTTSAFLPDVIVAQTLKRLGNALAARPPATYRRTRPPLDAWVNLGLQKLYRYQHADGGWNWWEFDQTDGDMTAYVLWALLQAKEAGYLVDDQRILRGTAALLRLLNDEHEANRRADWLLTLAYADHPEHIVPLMSEAFAQRDRLDRHALASLCLALTKMATVPLPKLAIVPPFHAMAVTVAGELAAQAVVQGTIAHWPAESGGTSWRNDDVEVTAHVLRALLAATPQSPQIPAAVRWLMGNRSGKAWDSTKASAEAILALSQRLEQTKELQPEYRARVAFDGRDGQTVQEFTATPQNLFDAPILLTLSPAQWRGHKEITIGKEGAGVLYITATTAYTIPAAEAKPLGRGLAVRRRFRILAEDPSHAGTVASGEDIEVDVEITADANYRYAIVEDPIPAGCEVASADEAERPQARFERGMSHYVRQETRDNRVVFFFDNLPQGRTLVTYRLHAETPGTYRVLPDVATLAYFPEVRGNSAPVKANIGER